jgi:hypothetical protein
MPNRILMGAMCVQRFDGSLNSAIHITYRISLRSSSMPEPRDPQLKILIFFCFLRQYNIEQWIPLRQVLRLGHRLDPSLEPPAGEAKIGRYTMVGEFALSNDPSAGSPTETLLRLLLPLNDRVWMTFRPWVVVAHLPRPVRQPH